MTSPQRSEQELFEGMLIVKVMSVYTADVFRVWLWPRSQPPSFRNLDLEQNKGASLDNANRTQAHRVRTVRPNQVTLWSS